MNVWDAGCDGVFMFNNSGLRDMKLNIEQNWSSRTAGTYQEGLAATVKGKEFVNTLSKTYFANFRGVGVVAGGSLPHNDYINIPMLDHYAPIVIGKDKRTDVAIRISDTIKAAAEQGKTPSVTVSIFMFGDPDSVRVAINGSALDVKAAVNQHADLEQDETEYVLSADILVGLIKTGSNVFSFDADREITLLDMWVDLDYPGY